MNYQESRDAVGTYIAFGRRSEPESPTWRGVVTFKDGPTLSGTISNVTKTGDSDADAETFTCDFTPDQETQQ